jgi:predicted MFS family arabinose efflux permease
MVAPDLLYIKNGWRFRPTVAGWALRYPPRSTSQVVTWVFVVAVRRPAEGTDMIELLEQQKKLTANQWKLICTANVADLLDFFDFFLIGYVTAALTKQWSLTYWEGGSILLASGLGAVPGAFYWGWLGDRIGRRTVFILVPGIARPRNMA